MYRFQLSLVSLSMLTLTMASAQVDVWFPNANAASGIAVTEPFGAGNFSAQSGSVIVQRLDATLLQAAGLTPGSVLQDVAFSPTSNGTLSTPTFQAIVGLVVSPWNTTVLLPNLIATSTVYDSATQGLFTWTVTGNTWNTLNTAPVGVVWDGVSDIGIYILTGNVTISGAGAGTPAGGGWFGTFHSGDGTIQRNVAPSFATGLPPTTDFNGLKTRLTFLNGPPVVPGTVTFLPSNTVTPGNGLTVVFNAPSNASETYIPFVSCTPGLLAVPGTSFSIPLNFDVCSNFYFNHALSSILFPLTPSGQLFGTLSTAGFATGVVFMPATLVPPGLNLTVSIAFVTANGSTITGAHGPGSFTIL